MSNETKTKTIKARYWLAAMACFAFSASAFAAPATGLPATGLPVPGLPVPEKAPSREDALIKAIKDGTVLFDVRLRYERVDQDGFSKDASAPTIRTRFGYETAPLFHTKLLLEFENVTTLGNDRFNDTVNGKAQLPIVADPETTEINRAQLSFDGVPDTKFTLGRQRINLNNQRFVGGVGFRQNEQTFDAIRIGNASLDPVKLTYAYIGRVHRVFGDDNPLGEFDSNSHMVQGETQIEGLGHLAAYALLLDLDEALAVSTATFGARLNGKAKPGDAYTLFYVAEYAKQKDHGNNPSNFDLDYVHGELGLGSGPVGAKVGFELLGSDGVRGFSTPLATLHKFQGWADVFLNTPASGIQDIYFGVNGGWKQPPIGEKITAALVYHDFESEEGSTSFGHEFDAVVTTKLTENVSFQLKAAFFEGDAAGFADRNKFWASLHFSY